MELIWGITIDLKEGRLVGNGFIQRLFKFLMARG